MELEYYKFNMIKKFEDSKVFSINQEIHNKNTNLFNHMQYGIHKRT